MSEARTAVVTGGNRGIGLEIARQLVDRGIRVVTTGRDEAEGRRTALQIGADFTSLDVTDAASIERLAQRLAHGFDILVNNAGISMHGFDENVVAETLSVNFHGARNVTRRLLPLLRGYGRIVMVSSAMGELSALSEDLRRRFSDPTLTEDRLLALTTAFQEDVKAGRHVANGWPSSAYRISKVAMNAYTRILARELRDDPRHILVNAACPGWVRTAMGGPSAPRSPAQGARTPTWLALLPPDGPSGGFYRDEAAIPF